MRDYYEQLWQRLPEGATPEHFVLRRRFLLDHVDPGARVLDVGCGQGDFSGALAEAGAAPLGVDVAQAAILRARARHPGVEFRVVQIEDPLPLADNSFDVVWGGEVIEHIADTATWLSELRRVLAPTGRLLLSTPNHGRLRLLLGGIERFSPPLGDHLHLYSRRSLQGVLREFGFGEAEVRIAAGLPLLRHTLLALAVR